VPTYAYACTMCAHRFEAHQSFTEASLSVCPECCGRLRKVFPSVGVVFKGSGFYRNDSRSGHGDKVATGATMSHGDSGAASGAGDSGGSSSSSDSGTTSPATTPATASSSGAAKSDKRSGSSTKVGASAAASSGARS
jgi:putative FmdB family regulatory protein